MLRGVPVCSSGSCNFFHFLSLLCPSFLSFPSFSDGDWRGARCHPIVGWWWWWSFCMSVCMGMPWVSVALPLLTCLSVHLSGRLCPQCLGTSLSSTVRGAVHLQNVHSPRDLHLPKLSLALCQPRSVLPSLCFRGDGPSQGCDEFRICSV